MISNDLLGLAKVLLVFVRAELIVYSHSNGGSRVIVNLANL